MSDFNNQWVEIFRIGDYGPKGKYDSQFLSQVVANFEPKTWQAPLTMSGESAQAQIGHRDDAPALGWVKELKADNGVLKARFEKVHPELETLVQDGRFPNRSAGFYTNPQGNGPVLRHVAFLGAMPPEVKGLAPIAFGENQEFVTIYFSEEDPMDVQEIKKTFSEVLREFAESVGLKKKVEDQGPPAKTFSEAEMEAAKVAAAASAKAEAERQFAEQKTAAEKLTAKKAAIQAFIGKLTPAGKWLPAFKEAGLVEFMEALPNEATLEFGEGDKKKKLSPLAIFQAFLEGLPARIEFGERKAPAGKLAANIQSGAVLPSSVEMRERAQAIATERKISFGEALKQARREINSAAV